MNSKPKIFLLTFVISFAILAIVISIQTANYEKTLVKTFESLQEKTCRSIFETGYKRYVLQDDKDYTASLEKIKGAPLSEEEKYEQFKCFVTNLNEGINVADLIYSGKTVVSDVHVYYDSEMNSIMKENTLLLVRKNLDADSDSAKKTRAYYMYQDDSLTEQMQDLFHKSGERIGTLVFEVKGGYIRGEEFVPERLSYYSVGEGGSLSNVTDLYTTAKSREEMEKDGFQYLDLYDAFNTGNISGDSDEDSFMVYCSEVNSEKKDRIKELIAECQNWKGGTVDGRTFIKKKAGLFTYEYFSLTELRPEDTEELYYAVTYEKKNALFDILSYNSAGGNGLMYVGLIIIEIIVAIVLTIVAAVIIIRVKKQK